MPILSPFTIFVHMKLMYIIIGSISLVVGIIGIFLPVLPTTPFLLLAASLYFRGSPRLYAWLLSHKRLGPYIRSFREDKAMPLRAKVVSILLMWGTGIHCICFVFPFIWLKVVMAAVMIAVTVYILSLKTRRA